MQKSGTQSNGRYSQLSDRGLVHFFVMHLDQDAFAEIVRRYERLVMSVCRRATCHREDAEDAFQATFIALAHRPRQLRKAGSLSSWLYRVAWRTSVRARRLKRKHTMKPLPEETIATVDQDSFLQIARDRDMTVLDQELNELPDHYRDVLVWNYFVGRTAQQIADDLQTSKGVVDGRLQRAKNALRVRLVRRGVTMSALAAAVAYASEAASDASPALMQQTLTAGLQIASAGVGSATASTAQQLARPETGGIGFPLVPAMVMSALLFAGAVGWQRSGNEAQAGDDGVVLLNAVVEQETDQDEDATKTTEVAETAAEPDSRNPTDVDAVYAKAGIQQALADFDAQLLSAEGEWGTLAGQILMEGAIPARKLIHAKGAPVKDGAVCAAANLLDESLLVDEATRGIEGCFVYLLKAPSFVHPALSQPAVKNLVQDQLACRFVPHAMIVQVGQSVESVSADAVAHNIHTHPLKNQATSIITPPLSRPGRGVLFTPTNAEILPFAVKCDFHPWMTAYWLVLDHPYAAMTDSEGRFRIAGLPAGLHEFRIWHERVGYIDRKYRVIIRDGEVTEQRPLKVDVSRFE